MKRNTKLALALACMIPLPAAAHDVANFPHTHVYQQTGYGTYRIGHYVNGPQGNIIIWSPRTYSGYQQPTPVPFARPQPITRAPSLPMAPVIIKKNPALEYGKTPNQTGAVIPAPQSQR